jgi:hypothetical protein
MGTFFIILGASLLGGIISTVLNELCIKWFKREPQRIIYAVDITLRGTDETLDDFIMRAYNDHLGEYRIV